MVEFISYDGKYPCLCMGTLKISVDGKIYTFKHAMISGGGTYLDDDWDIEEGGVEKGDWEIDLREHPGLERYKEEITRLVNENVEHGCCGGCI